MNIPILLYHSVSDQSTSLYRQWAISPSRFEEHMAYLYEHGYQAMTMTSIAKAMCLGESKFPERPVGITFDDGLADFLDGAVPVLRKYGFTATLFVATGFVGETSRWLADLGEQDRPMLTWGQLAALGGIEIGSHGHTHPQMDIVSPSQAQDEIIQSKKLLEQHLGRTVDAFAFPHGYHTKRLLKVVKNAGYLSASIVDHRMANVEDDAFTIPRIIITADITTDMLAKYLEGEMLRRKTGWGLLMKAAWRATRFAGVERFLPPTNTDY